ncbi:hypothetical protein N9B17_00225 [Rhodopirellula sp.]|nr:hypothetical protein [Rhodopirellula sp.]
MGLSSFESEAGRTLCHPHDYMIYAPLKRTNREATDEHLKPFAGRNDERQEGTLTPSK